MVQAIPTLLVTLCTELMQGMAEGGGRQHLDKNEFGFYALLALGVHHESKMNPFSQPNPA